jgi:hypothetical protein
MRTNKLPSMKKNIFVAANVTRFAHRKWFGMIAKEFSRKRRPT